MSDMLKFVNITVAGVDILFCLIAVIVLLIGTMTEKKIKNYFLAIFLCLPMNFISNIVSLMNRDKAEPIHVFIFRGAKFSEFFFGFLLSFILSLYTLYIVNRDYASDRFRNWKYVFHAIFAVEILLLVVNRFTGWFYMINEQGSYVYGSLIWIAHMLNLISLTLAAILLFSFGQRLTKKKLAAFFGYIIPPAVAMIVQFFIYDINWVLPAFTLSAIAMLVTVISAYKEEQYKREADLAELRSAIMLSQIQPHFLHNALVSIAQLCENDPKQAKRATITFSEYLRENMNSLKEKEPVPFTQELKHLKSYIALEQLRFGDRLIFELDIETEDFRIPVLTVQPLVENAVKHGIGMKEEGGTITLCTREFPDCYMVTVSDTGVGFDEQPPTAEAGRHVGIQNVRSRLAGMCGGTLEILSEKGKGTKAIIRIPKEGRQ